MNIDLLITMIAIYLIRLNQETWFMPEESIIKNAIDFLLAIGIITGSIQKENIKETKEGIFIQIPYKQEF